MKNASKNHHGPRPCLNWEEAFASYASLPAEKRNYARVAKQYDVSWHTVEKWARRGRWDERVAEQQAEAAGRLRRRQVRALTDRMESVVRLADASMAKYAEDLARGLTRVTPQDLVALAKLQLLLEGRATDRFEQVYGEVIGLSDAELELELEEMRLLDDPDY